MVDHAVGKILDHLEEKDQLENTLIIFTSDHGEMLQDKGLYSKEVPYEGSVRVPMVLKLPKGIRCPEHLPQDGTNNNFVDTLDLLPTCLDICGLTYPGNEKYELPGCSVMTRKISEREIQMSSFSRTPANRWVMAKSKKYKYIWNYNGGYEECYDLTEDPGETVNLFDVGKKTEEVDALRIAVLEWEKQWGPDWAIENGQLKVFPKEEHHPSHSGKFHKWSNMQMQAFDKSDPAIRGNRLLMEIGHAMYNKKSSAVELNDVFNDSEWIASFEEHWKNYGPGADWHKIFHAKKT